MIIRSEQMAVFEDNAEEGFVKRLIAHLREEYSDAIVRRSEGDATVKELSDEIINELVCISIQRAKSHNLTFESSISAFTAIMFEVAPNFDKHNLSNLCLKDQNIEPNDRLDEVLKTLNESHWEKIKSDYDINAWNPIDEKAEETEIIEDSDNEEGLEFEDTLIDSQNQESIPNKTAPDKSLGFNETFMPEKIGDIKDKTDSDGLDFDPTVVNLDIKKE